MNERKEGVISLEIADYSIAGTYSRSSLVVAAAAVVVQSSLRHIIISYEPPPSNILNKP
jgi:hypothetical protein